MRQLCFIIAMLGDDPEDTLARAMVKWLLGQGVNVMTMSPAKGEGNHSYPLERVEKAIAWLQAHGTHFVFPEGMMKNRHSTAIIIMSALIERPVMGE